MATGMEMMVKSLVKMMGLDPVKLELVVEEIRKSLSNAAADMATIRRQNTAIMAHLGIPDITEDREHDQSTLPGRENAGAGDGIAAAGRNGSGADAAR